MTEHDLSGYIEVPNRIKDFIEKYPEGCLRCAEGYPTFEVHGEQTFIVYKALAYRTPDDTLPAMGMAWEPFPGLKRDGKPNPYTFNSELMNAETSAWGRALAALGFVGKKIATLEDVVSRRAEESGNGEADDIPWEAEPDLLNPEPPKKAKADKPASDKQLNFVRVLAGQVEGAGDMLQGAIGTNNLDDIETSAMASKAIETLSKAKAAQ